MLVLREVRLPKAKANSSPMEAFVTATLSVGCVEGSGDAHLHAVVAHAVLAAT